MNGNVTNNVSVNDGYVEAAGKKRVVYKRPSITGNDASMMPHSVKEMYTRRNKTVSVSQRINTHHRMVEPLCCINSMLIREGCISVAVFELATVAFVAVASLWRLLSIDDQQKPTSIDVVNLVTVISHPTFCYLGIAYCLITLIIICLLFIGVHRFNANLVKAHLVYQYVTIALAIGCGGLLIVVGFGLITANGEPQWQWTTRSQLLAIICGLTIIYQIWGISVITDCYGYFRLCEVLINLAEFGHA